MLHAKAAGPMNMLSKKCPRCGEKIPIYRVVGRTACRSCFVKLCSNYLAVGFIWSLIYGPTTFLLHVKACSQGYTSMLCGPIVDICYGIISSILFAILFLRIREC